MRDDIKVAKKAPKSKPAPAPIKSVTKTHKVEEPEEVIVIDDGEEVREIPSKNDVAKAGLFGKIKLWWKSLDRNWRFGIIAAGLLVFFAAVIGIYNLTQPRSNPSITVTQKPKVVKPITIASPLTGVQVDPSLAARPVTGIMIENSDFARPQSGLQDAGVVYEAIAEAGITRFLALFQEGHPNYIGPVRSLRPYYIDYAAPFQANIVHIGGSPDALKIVRNGDFRDLDQFFNSAFFTRISSREAPHNVYTSFKGLDQLEKSKGYTKSQFVSWPRKPDTKLAAPAATSIDFKISGPDYYVHYDYNPTLNAYVRSEGGKKHTEIVNASGTKIVRLTPKVVVALVVPLGNGQADAQGAYYSDYRTSGSGVAYVFQDGAVIKGTWTKEGTMGQLQFTDPDGHPLKFNAGQTWITLVSNTGQIFYSK